MMAEIWEKNRLVCLGAIFACLLVITTLYYIFSGWGLITIHAKNEPLAKIIKSIEWQGWVKIESSLDPKTLVTMDVQDVPLPDAMESLAVNSDSRWKLSFFVGQHKATITQGMQVFTGGVDLRDNGWKTYSSFSPFQLGSSEDDPVPNPYLQTWNVKVTKPDLQGYLEASAQAADISIFVPQDWNPTLASAGAYPTWSITSGIAQLAYKAGGTYEEVLTLQPARRPRPTDNRPRGDGNAGDRFGGFDQDQMWDRVDNIINGLPSDAQAAARQKVTDAKTFFASLATMSQDDRRKAMREHFADQMGDRNWRSNPTKRAARYAQSISTKSSVMGTSANSAATASAKH